jgi:hypothetical protein
MLETDCATQTAALWKYMDDLKWWESLPTFHDEDFLPGDVFIEKCYGAVESVNEAIIRAGQAVLSHVSNGSSNSAHALILLDPRYPMLIAEAAGGRGLRQETIRDGRFTVYRCTDKVVRELVVEVADYFTGISAGKGGGDYATLKCAVCTLRSKELGVGAEQYLKNLLRLWEQRGGLSGNQDLNDMFCSEFVMAMYEVARMRKFGATGGLFGGVDPRAMSVKALEAQLNANASFQLLGAYRKGIGAIRLTR